jgi:tetratricopeptide (TPR) repeat protein
LSPTTIDVVLPEAAKLRARGKFDEAIELLDAALREALNARLFYSRAMTFELMAQPHEAVRDFTSAISLDRSNSNYYYDRGRILAFPLGKHDEAIHDFEQVLRLDPTFVEAHRQCCGSLLVMGRPNRALEHAKEAHRLAPHEASTHFYLGEAYFSLNQFRDAVWSLRRAVELDPTKEYFSSALDRARKRLN